MKTFYVWCLTTCILVITSSHGAFAEECLKGFQPGAERSGVCYVYVTPGAYKNNYTYCDSLSTKEITVQYDEDGFCFHNIDGKSGGPTRGCCGNGVPPPGRK